MAAVLSVQLECERSFVVDELGNATVCEAQYESRLAGGDKVQFLRSTFRPRGDGGIGREGTGDRSHELEEGRRHALLVPVSFRDTRIRLAVVHRLIKIVLPLLVTVLLLLLFLAQPVTSIPVSFVLLLLSKNQKVERSVDPLVRMGAVAPGFTESIFTDETVVELNVARLLFNLTKSSKILEANLAPPFAGDWTEGRGIRGQMTQKSSTESASDTSSVKELSYLRFSKFTNPCPSSVGGVTTFGITITSKILSKSQPISTSKESPVEV